MAKPAKTALQGESMRKLRPSASMRPSDGVGGCAPEPEEGERGFDQDGGREQEARLHQDHGGKVRHDMADGGSPKGEAPMARRGARGLHIFGLADHERGPTQKPREDGRVDDRDGDGGARGARTEHGDDADREQHHGKGEDHVHDPHREALEPAAKESGRDAESRRRRRARSRPRARNRRAWRGCRRGYARARRGRADRCRANARRLAP